MPLPPPNTAPATNTEPAAPVANAPAPAAAKSDKPKPAQFGPARGEDAVSVPSVVGTQTVDLMSLFSNIQSAVASTIGDVDDFVAGFEGMTKAQFPGNKQGRVAYDMCRLVKVVKAGSDRLEGKGTGQRTSKVAALQQQLEALKALLTPEQLAALGN